MIRKYTKIRNREIGHKDWWDRSCTRKKKKVKRAYIKWKKGKKDKEDYWEERKK